MGPIWQRPNPDFGTQLQVQMMVKALWEAWPPGRVQMVVGATGRGGQDRLLHPPISWLTDLSDQFLKVLAGVLSQSNFLFHVSYR